MYTITPNNIRYRMLKRIIDVHECSSYVINILGNGFREGVYHKALQEELRLRGNYVEMERRISVLFPTSIGTIKNIGHGRPDLLIFDSHIKYDDLFINEREMKFLIENGGERNIAPNGVGVVEIKAQSRITDDAIRQIEKQNRILELSHIVPAWSVLVNFNKETGRIQSHGWMRQSVNEHMEHVVFRA